MESFWIGICSLIAIYILFVVAPAQEMQAKIEAVKAVTEFIKVLDEKKSLTDEDKEKIHTAILDYTNLDNKKGNTK